jgi:hypothetical protein
MKALKLPTWALRCADLVALLALVYIVHGWDLQVTGDGLNISIHVPSRWDPFFCMLLVFYLMISGRRPWTATPSVA